jgi:hypothetical protein
MELCADIWFVEMFVGYTARGGGEEQSVCEQPGKSEMLVLGFYCRVKRIREPRVGFINSDDDDGGGGDTSLGDGDAFVSDIEYCRYTRTVRGL